MQYLEEWNLLQEDTSDRVERAVPPELPQATASKKEAANGETGRDISPAHLQLYEQHLSRENASYWTIEGGTGEQGVF